MKKAYSSKKLIHSISYFVNSPDQLLLNQMDSIGIEAVNYCLLKILDGFSPRESLDQFNGLILEEREGASYYHFYISSIVKDFLTLFMQLNKTYIDTLCEQHINSRAVLNPLDYTLELLLVDDETISLEVRYEHYQ